MRPVLFVLIALPVAAAAWLAGDGPWLNLLGRLTGIAGLAMMLVAAAVSIRIPGLDQPFGGLTRLWQTHRLLGTGAFLLLLAHPLLLAFSAAAVSPRAAAGVLWSPDGDSALWLGWAALLVLMAYLAPTFSFFGPPRYPRWKRLHALSALAVVLALAHTFMAGRSLPDAVWWAFAAVAIAALAFRLGWRKVRPGARYRIVSVTPLADRVVELALEPVNGPRLRYRPGQFVYLAPLDDQLVAGCGEEHPYTLCSAPDEPTLRIAIKALGDASTALQSVHPGTDAFIDGPYGRFFEPGRRGRELWIGGGIGITPFVGRARSFAAGDPSVDIDLVYCANDPSRAYYLDELRAIADRVPGFRVRPHFFTEAGPLDASWVAARITDGPARSLYVCGPAPLLERVRAIRRAFGITRRRFHSEEFDFL